jgi:ribosomal protein S18 acetylase RimI-like enzyme
LDLEIDFKTHLHLTSSIGIRRDKTKPYAFIWNIEIDPNHRGKGYGSQTMLALEEKVKELGLATIGLNVFGHNGTAIRLYQKLGYGTSSMTMYKNV